MFRAREKTKMRYFAGAAFLLLCLLIAMIGVWALPLRVHATPWQAQADTYAIHTAAELTAYSVAYHNGQRNPQDTLEISINEGSSISTDGFISLGTADHPFAGTLIVPSAGATVFHLYNCPLFDYVSTGMQITGAGTVNIMRIAASTTPAENVLTSGSLFANHVVGGGTADWSVSLLPYNGVDDLTEASSFDCVIGDIAANCEVTLRFTDTAELNVVGSGNTGLLCGTLNAGATLHAYTAGSGGNISVSTAAGHAGGLVGQMYSGSTLTLDTANLSRVNAVTTTAASSYAGGIVGHADAAAITCNVADYAVSGSVTGVSGAGGLFGYYRSTASPVTFSMQKYTLSGTITLSGTGSGSCAGGVFGTLVNEGAIFTLNGNAETFTVALSGGTNLGGLIGGYQTNALSNTLTVTNATTSITAVVRSSSIYSGGILGSVIGNAPAYISIYDVTCNSSAPYSNTTGNMTGLLGGLIGSIGSKGSFADISGEIKVTGKADAGILYHGTEGVLRLQSTTDHTTDLSSHEMFNWSSAAIMKTRGRVLVYALGDGKGTNGNWTLKRNDANSMDDIYSWGEVIRVDGTILTESDLFTVDAAAHTVTLKAAVPAMSTVTDFALTALNIKLNTGAPAGGALRFTDGDENKSDTLLAGTLSLTADISLSGTGLVGLTRDDGANNAFTGTFDGGGKTLTFATGEPYGLKGSAGTALETGTKHGSIYNHLFNGLFAKTGNGATVEDVTLNGNFMFYQNLTNMKLGGVAAQASGALTLDNVTVDFTVNYKLASNHTSYFGGAVGLLDGDEASLTVTDSSISPTFKDNSSSSPAGGNITYVGGVLGYVNAGETQAVSISDSTIGMSYTKTVNTKRESAFGSAIGGIQNIAYQKGERTVALTNVTVKITAEGTPANSHFGAILGMDWYSADVTINNLTVEATIKVSGTGTAPFGGLVQTATGHWDIQSIALTSAAFKLTANQTFGFVANKTYVSGDANGALYLDVNNTSSNYNIAALTFTVDPAFTVYDELVADSRFGPTGDITANGHSIVSITTSDNVLNTSGTTNAYLNQTFYGKTAAGAANPNTRYYYNLAHARANIATPKYNFLIFTVGQYAHSSLSEWFTASTAFTGALDMTGLSYYPVNLTKSVSFTNATIKLDYSLMNTWVKTAYTGDSTGVRVIYDSTTPTQHHMMHTALFLNVTAGITISGLTVQGNVPKISDGFCGFIVAKTLGGVENGSSVFNASNITLGGVVITDTTGTNYTDTTYAPLLINKIGKNTTLTIAGLAQSTTAYSSLVSAGKYAASSPIGDVGDATARAITLTFTDVRLDGRSAANDIGNLNTVYGTARSIFSRATLLNSFRYLNESSASYTFALDEDWSNSTTAIHHVTYGKEITTSAENSGLQQQYYGSTYYVHPTAYQSGSAYDFSTGFLAYVYLAYDVTTDSLHEVTVNVTFSVVIEGSGKYDDPFYIDDVSKLAILSKIIAGTDVGSNVQLNLPSDLASFVYTGEHGTDYSAYTYNFNTSTLTSSNGGDPFSRNDVRRYLAGAYYSITAETAEKRTLPTNYVALGAVSEAQYAFRGVILGNGKTIINPSSEALIYSSNGCVVKNLTISVSSVTIQFSTPSASSVYRYSGGIESYGAVIRQIMGGDTFLDGVHVTFDSISFTWTVADSDYNKLTPIGGYVGSLVNGGLIFRNMTGADVGLTSSVYPDVANSGYLYANPIIGRVLAGYAFLETGAYHATEATATLKNGTKNYSIPDLSLSEGKLDVTYDYTVNIPNGQAVYVLGAIVNSGAASATDGPALTNGYSDLNGTITAQNPQTLFWQGYAAHTATRAGAAYSGARVDPATPYANVDYSANSDYATACDDSYTDDLMKLPYIIRAYTKAYTSNSVNTYYARSISENAITIALSSNDDNAYDVAQGFRGIGNIYLDDAHVRVTLTSMNGNGKTITLHMRYLEYAPGSDNYAAATDTTLGNGGFMISVNAGFGFFNRLVMTGTGSSDYIKNFTLSGSVFYDLYDITDGTVLADTWANVSAYSVLNVGALAGVTYILYENKAYTDDSGKQFKVQSVHLDDLTVEGPKYVGGLVGAMYIYGSDTLVRYIDQCDADGLTVTGGKIAAGLIGYLGLNHNNASNNARLVIQGASANSKSVYQNMTITVKGPIDRSTNAGAFEPERMIPSAGGLLGYCDIGAATGRYSLEIMYVSVQDSELSFDSDQLSAAHTNFLGYALAGGMIGGVRGLSLAVHDAEVRHVSCNADTVGGVIAYVIIPRKTTKFAIYNFTLDGAKQNADNAALTAAKNAGGLIGWIVDKDNNETTFNYYALTLQNYTISSTGTEGGVGALFGVAETCLTSKVSQNQKFNIYNIKITDCVLSAKYTSATVAEFKGVGALIGVVTGRNNYGQFQGYNISVAATLGGTATANYGAIVGNNAVFNGGNDYTSTGGVIKIVGITTNITTTKTLGTPENGYNDASGYGSGYAVYANYKMVTGRTAHAGIDDSTTSADNSSNSAAASPYVTVNPYFAINGANLTGDGAANNVDNLPIRQIITDGASGKYAYAATASYDADAATPTTNLATFSAYADKLVMFKSEVTDFPNNKTDFPVLILDNLTRSNSHEMINSYLRLLTNTTFDFGNTTTNASIFDIKIYNMAYNGSKFVPSISGASLQLSAEQFDQNGNRIQSGQFHMTTSLFDTGKTQFSLIDVRFKDPTNASKVAYHLYVPVFVKRVLMFQFDVAVQTGTTYHEDTYTNRYGTALLENVGTPVTSYFTYTYTRTVTEWAAAINGGENTCCNYAKTLQFTLSSNDAFPAGTVMVLVDPNNGGRAYYAPFSAINNGALSLTAFRPVMTQSNGEISFSGEAFAPVQLCKLLESKLQIANGGTLVECVAADATFILGGQGYRPATDAEMADNTPKFSVEVKDGVDGDFSDFTESYYLTVFTTATANYSYFHYYIITAPSTFVSVAGYPAKMRPNTLADPYHPDVHLVMGKIFDHPILNFTVSSDSGPQGSDLINADNNQLIITMSAQMGLSSSLPQAIRSDVIRHVRAAKIYHTFLVYLNRRDGNTSYRAILGSPATTGSKYSIGSVTYENMTAYASSDIHVTQNYAEFITGDLHENFATGNAFTINAVIKLTWDSDAIASQFPGQSTLLQSNGVTVSGSSNISFSKGTAAFSKNKLNQDETNGMLYHSDNEPEIALLYLNPIGDGVGDFTSLGINALNLPGSGNSAEFDLLAVLDINAVAAQVASYADAEVIVELTQKQDNGTYGTNLDISEYLTFSVEGIDDNDITDEGTSYSVVIAKSILDDTTIPDVEIELPALHFEVKTGSAFEGAGFKYGNYYLTVIVQLRDSQGAAYTASIASNYVIYTNAKVVTQYLG